MFRCVLAVPNTWMTAEMPLFGECAVERFKHNGDKRAALRAFDLFEGLNVVVLRAIHDG